jgi:hypothetical protein
VPIHHCGNRSIMGSLQSRRRPSLGNSKVPAWSRLSRREQRTSLPRNARQLLQEKRLRLRTRRGATFLGHHRLRRHTRLRQRTPMRATLLIRRARLRSGPHRRVRLVRRRPRITIRRRIRARLRKARRTRPARHIRRATLILNQRLTRRRRRSIKKNLGNSEKGNPLSGGS